MTERAEGFWWVRLAGRWNVLDYHPDGDSFFPGSDERVMKHELAIIEWGPYLGKEPSDGGIGRAIELHQAYQDGDEGHTDPVFMLDMVGVALENYVAQPDEGLAERMRRKEAIALRARELRAEAMANALGLTTKPYEWPDAEREREAGERLMAKFPGLHAK